jgi:hypothetical protein
MADEAARRKAYEELGVRLFASAPEGFDPVEASAGELLLHGYPDRPDGQLHPKLYEHWKRVVSRSISKIEPQFGVVPIVRPPIGPAEPPPIGPIVRPPIGPAEPPPLEFPTHGTSGSWSGSVAYPRESLVTTVSGGWTVPTVTDPGGGSGLVPVCATWIGIDGWTEENSLATDIVQAGTTSLVGSAFAWWEWYSEDPVQIDNFAVSPGDVIYCTIRALSQREAAFYLVNETTRVAVLFPGRPTRETTKGLLGACAEWIVELPQGTFNGHPLELANFGSVTFDYCVAYGATGPILYPGPSELLTMVDASNYPLATPSVLADDSIRIYFAGPPRL